MRTTPTMKLLLLLLGLCLLAQSLPLKPAKSLLVERNADSPGGDILPYQPANEYEDYEDEASSDYNETLRQQHLDELQAMMAVQAAKDFDEYQKDPAGFLSRLRPISELEAILRAEASRNGSSNETTTEQPIGSGSLNETTTERHSGIGGSNDTVGTRSFNETATERSSGTGDFNVTAATERPSGIGGFNVTATEQPSGVPGLNETATDQPSGFGDFNETTTERTSQALDLNETTEDYDDQMSDTEKSNVSGDSNESSRSAEALF